MDWEYRPPLEIVADLGVDQNGDLQVSLLGKPDIRAALKDCIQTLGDPFEYPSGEWGSGDRQRRPCLSAAKGKCGRRDRAGAEECPGATPALLILRGGWSGIPPLGDAGGTEKMQGA